MFPFHSHSLLFFFFLAVYYKSLEALMGISLSECEGELECGGGETNALPESSKEKKNFDVLLYLLLSIPIPFSCRPFFSKK